MSTKTQYEGADHIVTVIWLIHMLADSICNSFSSVSLSFFFFLSKPCINRNTHSPSNTHTHSARQLCWTLAWRQAFRFCHGNQTTGIAAQKSLWQRSGQRNRLCCTIVYTIYADFVSLLLSLVAFSLFFLFSLLSYSIPPSPHDLSFCLYFCLYEETREDSLSLCWKKSAFLLFCVVKQSSNYSS